jgi:hypothetical protein
MKPGRRGKRGCFQLYTGDLRMFLRFGRRPWSSNKCIVCGLRLRGYAVCRKVYLVDPRLNRFGFLAVMREGKSLIRRRGNTAAKHKSHTYKKRDCTGFIE